MSDTPQNDTLLDDTVEETGPNNREVAKAVALELAKDKSVQIDVGIATGKFAGRMVLKHVVLKTATGQLIKRSAIIVGKKIIARMVVKLGVKVGAQFALIVAKLSTKAGSRAVLGPIGAVLFVFDVASLVLDLIDPFKLGDVASRSLLDEMENDEKGQIKEGIDAYFKKMNKNAFDALETQEERDLYIPSAYPGYQVPYVEDFEIQELEDENGDTYYGFPRVQDMNDYNKYIEEYFTKNHIQYPIDIAESNIAELEETLRDEIKIELKKISLTKKDKDRTRIRKLAVGAGVVISIIVLLIILLLFL